MQRTLPNESSASPQASARGLARLGMALADWSERWFPDAFVFALVALLIVFVAGLLAGSAMRDLVRYFGEGFWSIIPFTMQMAIIIIGGYVVATSPPVHRLIRRLAIIPRSPRGAVAFVAFFSMATSLVSWGLSLIFSGLLVREIVKNIRNSDYRAIGAAAYLGTGTVWALGLSSSAALLMATPASIPAGLLKISGVIPLTQTIYTWQSLATAAILMFASVLVAYLSAPAKPGKTVESFEITEEPPVGAREERRTPAEWLEFVPVLPIAVGLLGLAYLGQVVAERGPLAALDLNTYNFLFLMAGLLLHWKPRSFTRAVNNAVPATAGVLIQFPFYGGIFGIVTMSPISRELAHLFVHVSSQSTFPLLVAIYSGILGLFVPSGGSKWIIEAPYVLQAAKDLHVNLGWVVQIYNTAEALPNLVNPFWMLPLLGILKARARDLAGYGFLYLMVNSGLVLFFMWFFARTFGHVPPAVP
ncbi:MAG TPA: TIGR00366 family protein [Candidatus Polarisedimenticolia bacterium]|nr:TIGR00366 family protein [Candidatus Polarisedimenticolia bacterium]